MKIQTINGKNSFQSQPLRILLKSHFVAFEVELKFPVKDLGDIKERLRKIKALFVGREVQEDIYFNGMDRDFKETDEALRVRKVEDEELAEFTYKGPKLDTESKTREEVITMVSHPENMKLILLKLGFNQHITVRKIRENWKHEGYNIALDDVDRLGSFVELEMLDVEEEYIPAKVNELKAFAIQIGIDPETQIRAGYLDLLVEKHPHIS